MAQAIRQDEIFLSAVVAGQADKVREMLLKGAVVNANCQHSATPLHWAASHDHADVVSVLLEFGGNVSAKADDGCTALHFACREDCTDAARLLLEAGADPNALNASGSTPFDCIYDDEEVPELVTLLKEHGYGAPRAASSAARAAVLEFKKSSSTEAGPAAASHEIACGGDADEEEAGGGAAAETTSAYSAMAKSAVEEYKKSSRAGPKSGTHEVASGGDADEMVSYSANAKSAVEEYKKLQQAGSSQPAACGGEAVDPKKSILKPVPGLGSSRRVSFSGDGAADAAAATSSLQAMTFQCGDDADADIMEGCEVEAVAVSKGGAATPALSMRCLNGVLDALEGKAPSPSSAPIQTMDISQLSAGPTPQLSLGLLTGVLDALEGKSAPATDIADLGAPGAGGGGPDISTWGSFPQMSMGVLSGVLAALGDPDQQPAGQVLCVDEDGNECVAVTPSVPAETSVSVGETSVSIGEKRPPPGPKASVGGSFGLSMSDPFQSAFSGPGFVYGYDGDGGNNIFGERKHVQVDRSELEESHGTDIGNGKVEMAIG